MEFEIYDLGLVDFKKAWDFQKEVFLKVKQGLKGSTLVLCRHYPVITLGRLAKRENLKISDAELRERGIQIYSVERGGDITYHGPGQQMLYFILNLRHFKNDLHLFLRYLEDTAIDVLSQVGIFSQRISGLSGVWVGNQKISSLGIAVKNWITYHGLAINVRADDLANFALIRPCGLDIKMTSMETVLGKKVSFREVKESLIRGREYDQSSLAGIRTGY
jgi:lipoate-protein ligase B